MAKGKRYRKSQEALAAAEFPVGLTEASSLLKKIATAKFDESVDICVQLGVDPKKADQLVRGVVALPHGTGRDIRVLVLASEGLQQEAKDAGAEYVGLQDLADKIKGGWTEFDVVVASPDVMAVVGQLGKVLGPRGLMPNPKSGTVTREVGKAVGEVKAGKIDFRVDKQGNVHTSIGRASFTETQIEENMEAFLREILRLRPASAKGIYVRGIDVSSTMSPPIELDHEQVVNDLR